MFGHLRRGTPGHREVGGRGPAGGLAVQRHLRHGPQPVQQHGEHACSYALAPRPSTPPSAPGGYRLRRRRARQVVHRRGDPGQSANGGVPCSNRSGTLSGRGRQLVRPQRRQQPGSATDRPDVRARPLVGAGGVEIRAERRHVGGAVRGRVHPVHVPQRARGARPGGDLGDGRAGAEHVAGGGDRHQPGPLATAASRTARPAAHRRAAPPRPTGPSRRPARPPAPTAGRWRRGRAGRPPPRRRAQARARVPASR